MPMFRTPEQISSKFAFLEQRPPSFILNSRQGTQTQHKFTLGKDIKLQRKMIGGQNVSKSSQIYPKSFDNSPMKIF